MAKIKKNIFCKKNAEKRQTADGKIWFRDCRVGQGGSGRLRECSCECQVAAGIDCPVSWRSASTRSTALRRRWRCCRWRRRLTWVHRPQAAFCPCSRSSSRLSPKSPPDTPHAPDTCSRYAYTLVSRQLHHCLLSIYRQWLHCENVSESDSDGLYANQPAN